MGPQRRRRTKKIKTAASFDIEQELQQQRLKKQMTGRASADAANDSQPGASKTNPLRLGNFVYDPVRQAYFPKKYVQQNSSDPLQSVPCQAARRRKFPPGSVYMNWPERPAVLSHVAQLCQRPWDRRNVVSQWAGRICQERTNIQYIPLCHKHQLCHNYIDDYCVRADMVSGLYAVSPWNRHFEIMPTTELPRNLKCAHAMSVDNRREYLSSQHLKLLNIRGGAKTYGHLLFDRGQVEFRLWDGNRGLMARLHNADEMHDFALLPHLQTVVLGGKKGRQTWFNYQSQWLDPNPPKTGCVSDILCVETDCLSSSRPQLVFHGHRNGSITMHDTRTDQNSAQELNFPSPTVRKNDGFGSVVRIQLLFDQRPDQLLARGSLGSCCRLFDVRCLGGQSTHRYNGRSAMIHEMVLPAGVATAARNTANTACSAKGMATDPCRAIAIVPFIEKSLNACFGMWSLDSGDFIGPIQQSRGSIYGDQAVELCPTITRAWQCKVPAVESDASEPPRAEAIPGSYGLWFGRGEHTSGHIVFRHGSPSIELCR
jgi:hypothetical protein